MDISERIRGKNNYSIKIMKKKTIFLAFIILFFSSCAYYNGLTHNSNLNNTEVVLSQKNFRVIAWVKGKSSATYVLGIGGLSKNALIAEAKENMLAKADIIGGSKAIINETVELKNTFFLIFWVTEVTVSANIIEFYNNESDIDIVKPEKKDTVIPVVVEKKELKNEVIKNENKTINNKELKAGDKSLKVGDKVKFNDETLDNVNYGKIIEIKENTVLIQYIQFGKKNIIEKKFEEILLVE